MTAKRTDSREEVRPNTQGASRSASEDGAFLEALGRAVQWGDEPEGGSCRELLRTIASARGELDPGDTGEARRHASACSSCFAVYRGVKAGLLEAEARRGQALELPARVWKSIQGRGRLPVGDGKRYEAELGALEASGRATPEPRAEPWFDYDDAEVFRDDAVRCEPLLEWSQERFWPSVPEGGFDWAGVLLQVRRPGPLDSDSEARQTAQGRLVRVARGKVRAIEFFDIPLTHEDVQGDRFVVSGALPPAVLPLDPEAHLRCAWVARKGKAWGRLWLPESLRLHREEGRFLAQFPFGAPPAGEFRLLLVEVARG
jgi:hypothetical protein